MPRALRVGLTLAAGFAALSMMSGGSNGQTTTNPYRVTLDWEKLPEGREMGTVSGVGTSGYWTAAAPTSVPAQTSIRS